MCILGQRVLYAQFTNVNQQMAFGWKYVYYYVYLLQDDVQCEICGFFFSLSLSSIYKPLIVAFLLFAGEYRVDDVPHDVSRAC